MKCTLIILLFITVLLFFTVYAQSDYDGHRHLMSTPRGFGCPRGQIFFWGRCRNIN